MQNLFGDKKIQIVRHVGDLQSAYLPQDGITVKREVSIVIKDMGVFSCAGYDNHFIFRHVFRDRGWSLWCTCGSPACVTGYDAYAKDASPSGQMIICMHHGNFNKHMDGSK